MSHQMWISRMFLMETNMKTHGKAQECSKNVSWLLRRPRRLGDGVAARHQAGLGLHYIRNSICALHFLSSWKFFWNPWRRTGVSKHRRRGSGFPWQHDSWLCLCDPSAPNSLLDCAGIWRWMNTCSKTWFKVEGEQSFSIGQWAHLYSEDV